MVLERKPPSLWACGQECYLIRNFCSNCCGQSEKLPVLRPQANNIHTLLHHMVSYLIVRLAMQYFHILFHKKVTSARASAKHIHATQSQFQKKISNCSNFSLKAAEEKKSLTASLTTNYTPHASLSIDEATVRFILSLLKVALSVPFRNTLTQFMLGSELQLLQSAWWPSKVKELVCKEEEEKKLSPFLKKALHPHWPTHQSSFSPLQTLLVPFCSVQCNPSLIWCVQDACFTVVMGWPWIYVHIFLDKNIKTKEKEQ